jgi:hypothetical protein
MSSSSWIIWRVRQVLKGHGFRRAIEQPNKNIIAALAAASLLTFLLLATGCHSYHVETTVENRTGAAIQLLEVDYPSASFGANSLAAGADFHYRIQLRGSGPLKVQYTAGESHPVQIDGPTLSEPQQGGLQIVLLPGGKAEFHTQLTPQP